MSMNAEERYLHQKWIEENGEPKTIEEKIEAMNKEIEALKLENRVLEKVIDSHEETYYSLWETIQLYATKERQAGVTLDSVMRHIGWRR